MIGTITLEPVPFEEAIEAFKDKVPLTAEQFFALETEMQALAFTVAGISRMDILTDIHTAVTKAIEDGETLSDFQNRIADIFESRGWTAPEGLTTRQGSPKTPWRLETIFRSNVQTAYMTGRYKQMIDMADRFPYWEYDAVNDSNTRPTHAALDGKVFPADHEFWNTWYPPNGYNCRCGVNPVHGYVAEEEGLKVETDDPTGRLVEPVDPATGNRMPARSLMPDPGWDHNPAKEAWRPDLSKYPAELRRHYEQEREKR